MHDGHSPDCYTAASLSSVTAAPGRSGRIAGFTLIELLTVVAIIGILAAILVPAASNMLMTAKIARSTSNLRQIGSGVYLFVADNSNKLPISDDPVTKAWIKQLWPYTNPNQQFPKWGVDSRADVLADTIYYTPMVESDPKARSFGYNTQIDDKFTNRLVASIDPKVLCLVADSKTLSGLSNKQLNFRNRGKINVLFSDGRVELLGPESVPSDHKESFWRGKAK